MPETGFARPTLPTLVEQVRADLLARLSQDEVLRRSDLEVQARVQAAALHSLYGFIDYVARQILPPTADTDVLERHAAWWGIARKPATAASGLTTLMAAEGTVIPAGTVLQRIGAGDYRSAAEAVALSGVASVEVEAAFTGTLGNLPAGARLQLVSPIAGAQGVATVVEVSGGADAETDADLLARLQDRVRQPPHGGNRHDYEAWALEVPGVTRAWVYRHRQGLGTVGIAFVMDGRVSIIPTPDEVAAVQAYIDERRPVTSEAVVFAPIPDPLNLTIRVSPDSTAVREAVEAELRDFVAREAEPGGTLHLSRLREAISSAAGEFRHELIAPLAEVVASAGHIAVPGAITWVP
ncbi:baseplate J/gp47 family protein [Azospirillum soli]|uniref:baseplate J/gp47 family protein n=1 Tax=Azospirillum soli TaxID=1304799 RepID=UPI001AEAC14A|nr:baseplate J/gp47 family protein [Azospirillum soli]MBP2314891.1 putative phage protein gp47/JayE [Azospirillum soli]